MEVIPFLDKNIKEHHDRFVELLTTSHFLILPTRADCSSTVTCESNAYGMPSIATITGGVPEIVLDGVNGYCLPLEAGGEEFASLILKVFNDKKKYHDLILSSRMRYEECLNWDKWADHFQIIYEQRIRNQKKPAAVLQAELC
jgi:glycosyltransferase involved in cell wall biosynthesis